MPSLDPSDLASLLSQPSSSTSLTSYLQSLSSTSPLPVPEIKSYPDTIYHNYYPLGLSLAFHPIKGLDSIDIYNSSPHPQPKRANQKPSPVYSSPPEITLHFPTDSVSLPPKKEGEKPLSIPRSTTFKLLPNSTGRDFVSHLGEPTRKGSGGWTGLWLEWSSVELKAKEGEVTVGIMVELRDPGANELLTEEGRKKGMGGVWERASRWEWSNIKFFKVGQ
ncbi:hypothetical protein I204_00146 [Kwoniella mangroviensis CBS 8886]|uniref:uncharacterized protein n=1 Tax=Kwoniella mangroviensis CBS 8507 TaxID=1296122 RepID=UPI00080D0098|nr:uncharacterized protein I203_02678 [Kwoniella mangroviensis CBS 8507]OCF68019.1 hypothetical protein I203_02678 [Kwoniella mangroviensis CBS 8507]OCF78209.1 hypothetical protein I204_00146 [Kwoniella mangroviensis CBS 8886]